MLPAEIFRRDSCPFLRHRLRHPKIANVSTRLEAPGAFPAGRVAQHVVGALGQRNVSEDAKGARNQLHTSASFDVLCWGKMQKFHAKGKVEKFCAESPERLRGKRPGPDVSLGKIWLIPKHLKSQKTRLIHLRRINRKLSNPWHASNTKWTRGQIPIPNNTKNTCQEQ